MRLAYLITVLLILQSAIALAPEDAKIEYFVNDYAGLLTYDEISYIEPLLKEIYDSGNAEFAIVIVDTLEGHDIQGYSQIVADGNIGDPEKDNGLVLLISKEDRSYFFAVGRGLEPSLPDSVVGRVGRQYLVPSFKEGRYSQGIYGSVEAINKILLSKNMTNGMGELPEESTKVNILMIIAIILIIFAVLFIAAPKNSSRSDKDYFVAASVLSALMRGGKGGGSGGFGGFGGGSFGGGGAGGRW